MPDSSKHAPPEGAESADTAPPTTRDSSFAALRHRDFRLMWLGQFLSLTGTQMQFVTVNWHVYILTEPYGEGVAAAALGFVGLVRVLPIIVCSLVGGVVADAVDRKRLMLAAQCLMLVCAAALAALTWLGLKTVWPIYALTAIGAAAVAFDNPARQALLPALVPARDFPNAVSLAFIAFQVALMVGAMLGGLVLAQYGPATVYAVNAVSYLAVIVALLLIRTSGRGLEDTAGRVSFEALKEGLRFVWRTPVMVQTMTLDFAATFFASALALLPIFASDILNVGARGFGVLSAAPAIGGVVAGLALARRPAWRRPGRWVIASVAVYGATTLVFGVSRLFWLSLLMLALSGAADMVSSVIRQTIRQLITPDRLRGRMTSVNMIFFMGGPQLGELEAGLLAAALGAPASVVLGGVGCLAAVVFAGLKARELLSFEFGGRGEASKA